MESANLLMLLRATRGNFVFDQSAHLFTFWPLSQSERAGLFYFRFRPLFYIEIYCRK